MKTEFIKHSINKVSKNFGEDWWSNFEFSKSTFETESPETKNLHIQTFLDWSNKIREDIFDDLNMSILSGEYVSRKVFISDVEELKVTLKNITLFFSTPEIQEIILEVVNQKIISLTLTALDLYIDFYNLFKRRVDLNSKKFIYKINYDLNESLSEFQSSNDLEIFRSNLHIAYLDHFMFPIDANLNTLNRIIERFTKKLGIKEYSGTINLKAKFLKAKLILRKIHENQDRDIFYVENSIEKKLEIEEFSNPNISLDIEYIKNHYEISKNWMSNLEEQYSNISYKSYDEMSILEIHRAVKYFKDIRRNYEEIKKIREAIEKKWTKIEPDNKKFDRYSLGICLMYIANNEFSCMLDNDNMEVKEIESLYNKINYYSDSTKIKNFFPQLRYLKFLVLKLQKFSNNKILLLNLSEARKNIDRCRSIMREYDKNIEWCKSNYNYVFQLPFKDCFYEITPISQLSQVFIASSHVMPINKEKYLTEYNEYKSNIINLENTITVIENVETETRSLEDLKKEIKNREVRSMEIIGIFTAIVTFVVSSIPSFKFIENAYQALLFMFCLASSLGLFVSLMLLVTKGFSDLKENHIVFLTGLLLLVILSWVYLIKNPHSFI